MTRYQFCAIAPFILLAGCSAAEKASSDAFDTNFMSSCVDGAAGNGMVPREVAESLCTCALDKINETHSTSEKINLSPEKAQPIMAECVAEEMKNG